MGWGRLCSMNMSTVLLAQAGHDTPSGPLGAAVDWQGPSRAREAGCPSAREQGQGSASAITLGGPAGSWLSMHRVRRVPRKLRWLLLTRGALCRERTMPLLVGNPKETESVFVVRVQRRDEE